MIPGRLCVVARALAGATDRILDRLAAGPALSEVAALTSSSFSSFAQAYGVRAQALLDVGALQAVGADTLHHGCWTLHVCAASNTVSVIRPADACPICDPSPAASPAGDRPAAVSDGQLPTAPAAGHPNPLRDAADADMRITKRLSRLCQLDRFKRS